MFQGNRIMLAVLAVLCGGAGLMCFFRVLGADANPGELGGTLLMDGFIGALLGLGVGCWVYLVYKRKHGRRHGQSRRRRLEVTLLAGLVMCMGAGLLLAVLHCQSAKDAMAAMRAPTLVDRTNQPGATNQSGLAASPDKAYISGVRTPASDLNPRFAPKAPVTVLPSAEELDEVPKERAYQPPPEKEEDMHFGK
ncbi:MAG: hypothetical protein NTW03_16135 [Verrucomicrobia bacterium]|nr:hypothetical protein [Verrucomicrobiota bacterium]